MSPVPDIGGFFLLLYLLYVSNFFVTIMFPALLNIPSDSRESEYPSQHNVYYEGEGFAKASKYHTHQAHLVAMQY
jgi:hypothetical protein